MQQKSHLRIVEEACRDSDKKKDILTIMQNICEENEFVMANYYVPIEKTDKMTCKNQPYVCYSGIDGLDEFQTMSTET